MNHVIATTLHADPSGCEPLHKIVDAIRRQLPASAAPRRDEVIGSLSEAGYRLSFTGGQLHVAGVRL